MNHLSEEELVLFYYGEEASAAEQHLSACDACREAYGSLQRVLNTLDGYPVPEPEPDYSTAVWQNLETEIPARWDRRFRLSIPQGLRWATASVAVAGLMLLAFFAGRFYPAAHRQPIHTASADPQASERVLLVAVGDYLERSQMVLVELANANPKGKLDISAEQERASDLVSESRLYRQTAAHTGDRDVANVLDDIDRVLMDITHSPSEVHAADIEQLRQRLADQGILFKIRVLGSNLRSREDADTAPANARKRL